MFFACQQISCTVKFQSCCTKCQEGELAQCQGTHPPTQALAQGFRKLGRSGHSTQASRPCCSSRHQGQDVGSGAVTQDRSRHGGRMELKKQGWDKGSVALKTASSHVSPFSWLSEVGWGNRYQ